MARPTRLGAPAVAVAVWLSAGVAAGQPPELIIRNGTIITDAGTVQGDLRIRNGLIDEMGERLVAGSSAREIDASGLLVLPGGIDHVAYTREQKLDPGQTVQRHRAGMNNLPVMRPMLYSDGVRTGRITLDQFVALTATNRAKLFANRTFTLELDNNSDLVPVIAWRMLEETGDAIPRDQRAGVYVGLIELLMNAVEHGNLGITYEQKGAALRTDPDGLAKLTQRRLAQPDLAARMEEALVELGLSDLVPHAQGIDQR